MKNKQKIISAIMFLVILFAVPIANAIIKKQSFSEIENRNLAIFPDISLKTIADKSFMNDAEEYISDHFIGRTLWVKGKVTSEILMGKNEINGVYIQNGMMITKPQESDYEKADKAIEAINTFADNVSSNVYVMFVPTATGIYENELPDSGVSATQKQFLEYLYDSFDDNVYTIDVYNTLYAARDEYIYYRNDHHWTEYGAYCAYKTAIQRLGFSPVTYNKFHIEHASNSFKGSLYSKTLYDGIQADTIDLYHAQGGAEVTEVEINNGLEISYADDLYFRDYLDKKDKYLVYLGENQPYINIKTDVKNDKKILVIKDSYANSFIPFLAQHYSEITVLDLRYIRTSYSSIVDIENYSQTLILYNLSSIAEDETLKILKYN